LHTLKALLPEDPRPAPKYTAELHNILDFMEKGSGMDLSRYRLTSPVVRTVLRINILALLGVCAYRSVSVVPISHLRGISEVSTMVH
jgi:hypothetical protein